MQAQHASPVSESISFVPLLPAGGASSQPGATKVAGRVLIDLLASPGFAYVDAIHSGVLLGLIKGALVCGVTTISRPEAIRQAHLFSRSSRERAEELLETLHSAELIAMDDACVSIPALTAAVNAQDAEKTRRSQGWARRRALEGSATFGEEKAPASHAATKPEESMHQVSPDEAAGPIDGGDWGGDDPMVSDDDLMGAADGASASGQGSLLDEENDQATEEALVYLLEVDGGAPGDSEVAAEIVAKGGHIVQITKGYVAWLQSMCTHVDALAQVRKASGWCATNKARRKTVARMGTFLVGWINRADASAANLRTGTRSSSSSFGTGTVSGLGDTNKQDGEAADLDDLNELIALRSSALQGSKPSHEVPA